MLFVTIIQRFFGSFSQTEGTVMSSDTGQKIWREKLHYKEIESELKCRHGDLKICPKVLTVYGVQPRIE